MLLQVNSQKFEVDAGPIEERAAKALEEMILDKAGKIGALRATVKAACSAAMVMLGLEKQDRNDDPILLVAKFVLHLIFRNLEANGLIVTGSEIKDSVTIADGPGVSTTLDPTITLTSNVTTPGGQDVTTSDPGSQDPGPIPDSNPTVKDVSQNEIENPNRG